MAQFKSKEFEGPKSICTCGHTGDGEESEHYGLMLIDSTSKGSGIQYGMGICSITGCQCEKFVLNRPTKKYLNFMESRKTR